MKEKIKKKSKEITLILYDALKHSNPKTISRQDTDESIFYTVIYEDFNLYIEYYFDDKEVFITKMKDKNCVFNWGGKLSQLDKVIKKKFLIN